MDCMASKAAAKNGLVLSSLPAASGIMVRSLRATTECEFDLADTQIAKRLEPLDRRTTQRTDSADAYLNFNLTPT
jgi:hypothetical protein